MPVPRDRLFSNVSKRRESKKVSIFDDEITEMVWKKDAHNGFLSHSKMRFVRNTRQVRKIEVTDKLET